MHGKNLIKKFAMADDELSRLTSEALGGTTLAELDNAIGKTVAELAPNKIVRGKIIKVQEDGTVIIDVSYKAEGQISIDEFPDPLGRAGRCQRSNASSSRSTTPKATSR